MDDFTGRPISVGDRVAFNPPSYKGLIGGSVVGFTPQKVRVAFEKYSWMPGREYGTTVFPRDLVVIPR